MSTTRRPSGTDVRRDDAATLLVTCETAEPSQRSTAPGVTESVVTLQYPQAFEGLVVLMRLF